MLVEESRSIIIASVRLHSHLCILLVVTDVWYFHCHNDLHVLEGMGVMVQIGEPDEWKAPDNLSRCGPYSYDDQPPTTKDPMNFAERLSLNHYAVAGLFGLFLQLISLTMKV